MEGIESVRVYPQVFIRGANYIESDWMLRWSAQRYRDEVRMHAEVVAFSHAATLRSFVILTFGPSVLMHLPCTNSTIFTLCPVISSDHGEGQ